MWQWAPVNTFTDPKIPANEFVGDNPPYGAILSYYLPSAPKSAAIDILDAVGRVVRHLKGNDVPKHAGMNRAAWDLNEDGPAQWMGTYKENQGPDEGAEAVPGTYTVALTVDGVTREQRATVQAGSARSGSSQYQARYAFLAGLFSELGTINTMLNAIDARLEAGNRIASFRADGIQASSHL